MATIYDVAAAVGVSHQTVSRALQGDPTVREETRVRIDDAVRRLRYRPNAAARALARRRTRTLGLVVSGFAAYGPSSITAAFNAAARLADWDVSIEAVDDSDPAVVRRSTDALLDQNVEALVVVAPTAAVDEALGALRTVPVIATVPSGLTGAAVVAIDHARGGAAAVRHLAQLGHRAVAHVAGPAEWPEAELRLAGWRAESTRLGLLPAPEVQRGDWSARSGYRIGVHLAADTRPTAVFAANDQMAIGLLAAFRDAGLRVPEDVSLVGFDDIPEAAYVGPPLTTLRQDFAALGERLMAQVEAMLAGTVLPSDPLPPELVVRASTAPPH